MEPRAKTIAERFGFRDPTVSMQITNTLWSVQTTGLLRF